jgi:hypothetical protein
METTRLPCKFLTAWVSHPRCSGGQHYTLRNVLIRQETSAYSPKYSRQQHHRFMAAPCAGPWTVENTRDWMDKTPTSTHNLSVWSSSSLGRWHPRPSVLLVLTIFLCSFYDLTTILRSRALHRVLSLAIQYAWRSYMLSRLYRKVKTFRSDLLTYWMQHDTSHRSSSVFVWFIRQTFW